VKKCGTNQVVSVGIIDHPNHVWVVAGQVALFIDTCVAEVASTGTPKTFIIQFNFDSVLELRV
jgi:hypothetical protein